MASLIFLTLRIYWILRLKKNQKLDATKEEEKEAAAAGDRDLRREELLVYTSQLPVPVDLGIEADLLPTVVKRSERNQKGDLVKVLYYHCSFCSYSLQNCTSMQSCTQGVT